MFLCVSSLKLKNKAKPTWKAQKDSSAVTRVSCHAVQPTWESAVVCSLHNTVEVANSPPHQLCTFSGPENRHANTHFVHKIVLRALKLPAVHPEQQVDEDDGELHNDDEPPSSLPLFPLSSTFSSVCGFHFCSSAFSSWLPLADRNLLWLLGWVLRILRFF